MWEWKKVQTVLRPLRTPLAECGCLHAQRSWIGSFVALLVAAFPGDAAYIHTNLAPPILQREFRGAWLTTLNNIDWPSKPGLPAEEQKRELVRIIDRAAQIHLNAVLFQVRPACDAFYASRLEPWSEYLTGDMGNPPAPWYDPLLLAIEEAHKRGLELHAWFNPFRARHVSATNAPSSKHISRTNPQLVRKYGKDLWLDPGEPAACDHTVNVVMDVLRRYDVDGIVMDDYFYPYKEKDRSGKLIDFPDGASWQRYAVSGGKLSRDDWRRDNINRFVERIYRGVKAEKPHVKFGLSPFGIWRPKFPPSVAGLDAFADLYADSRLWLRQGWVDYLAPQLYWTNDAPKQSFPALLQWWAEQNVKGRHLWPGGTLGRLSPNYSAHEVVRQILLTRRQSGASGNIHFSFTPLLRNRVGITDVLLKDVYSQPALVPASPWLCKSQAPIVKAQVQEDSSGVTIAWASNEPAQWWIVQTRVEGIWRTEMLPGLFASKSLGHRPEVIALTGIDRCGAASNPEVMARVP